MSERYSQRVSEFNALWLSAKEQSEVIKGLLAEIGELQKEKEEWLRNAQDKKEWEDL